MIVVRHEWQLVEKNQMHTEDISRPIACPLGPILDAARKISIPPPDPKSSTISPCNKSCWFSGHLNLVSSYLTKSCSCYWITAAESHVGLGRDRLKLFWSISKGLRDSLRIWVCIIQVRLSFRPSDRQHSVQDGSVPVLALALYASWTA